MESLEALWKDAHDEGLPFSTSVNEALVLSEIKRMHDVGALKAEHAPRIRQWVRFNRSINAFEDEEPYVTWVATVYSQIEACLREVEELVATGDA